MEKHITIQQKNSRIFTSWFVVKNPARQILSGIYIHQTYKPCTEQPHSNQVKFPLSKEGRKEKFSNSKFKCQWERERESRVILIGNAPKSPMQPSWHRSFQLWNMRTLEGREGGRCNFFFSRSENEISRVGKDRLWQLYALFFFLSTDIHDKTFLRYSLVFSISLSLFFFFFFPDVWNPFIMKCNH